MRLALIAVFALFMLAAPAPAFAQESECSLKIIFGGYEDGIDLDDYENVRELLDESKEVDSYTDLAWGGSGERMICVQTFSMSATDVLYEDVLRHMPSMSRDSWMEVMHEDGRSRKTLWPD